MHISYRVTWLPQLCPKVRDGSRILAGEAGRGPCLAASTVYSLVMGYLLEETRVMVKVASVRSGRSSTSNQRVGLGQTASEEAPRQFTAPQGRAG